MKALIRRIAVAARDREVRAAVEDDFHHFRVTIHHDGAHVTAASAEALRQPWTLCGFAGEQLVKLVGMRLAPRASAVHEQTEQRLQCTHMFDLAGLSIAAAARGLPAREYQAVVPDRQEGRTTPRLHRDGREVMRWSLEGSRIAAPQEFGGVSLQAGFTAWTDQLDIDAAEAALVLRRAVFISGGRGIDLDSVAHAAPRGGCFVQQPDRAPSARRMIGSTVDWSATKDTPLQGDRSWLAFEA